MGMFDTIVLPEKVECVKCQHKIEDFQTKLFERLLNVYQIGDKVKTNHYIDGIFRDTLFCDSCYDSSIEIFFALKDKILISINTDKSKAEKEYKDFKFVELLAHFNRMNDRREEIENNYRDLKSTLRSFMEFLNILGEEKEGSISYLYMALGKHYVEEHLKGTIVESLKSILDKHA